MIYKKHGGEIPFKVGDKVEFFDWNNNGKFLRRGVVRRIDEYEF